VKIALHNDMFVGLNISLATWAAKGGVREELLLILTNGGVACGHAGEPSTQGIREPYGGEPRAILSIGGLDDVLLFIFIIQEQLSFLFKESKLSDNEITVCHKLHLAISLSILQQFLQS